MSLATLPTLLVVPPLNCLLAACAGAALRRRRMGRVLLAAGLSGLVLLSLPLVSGSLIASLEVGLPTAPNAADPPASIVILSGDMMQVEQDGHSAYIVGLLTLERERAGARLARATGLPVLVSGGRIRRGAPSLAALMQRSLQDDFGLATKWEETRSLDTWQNAVDSVAILRASGIGSAYVVTNAWHMRRALIAFHAAGLRVTASPVDPAAPLPWEARMLVPTVSSWLASYFALHEWIGCAWYWLHG